MPEGACVSYQTSLACPYCPKEPLDFQGLVQHLEAAHGSYPQRAAVSAGTVAVLGKVVHIGLYLF